MAQPTNPNRENLTDIPSKDLPRAQVRTGLVAPKTASGFTEPMGVVVRHMLTHSFDGEGDPPTGLQMIANCQDMPLFEPASTRVKPLPLWRRRLPDTVVPRLGIPTFSVFSPPIAPPHTKIQQGPFRPPIVRCHAFPPLPKARIAINQSKSPCQFWQLQVYSLMAFSANLQSYYRWYARDRLKLDLDDPQFQGLVCPLPPVKLAPLNWVTTSDQRQLMGYSTSPIQPSLQGRHGLVFQTNDAISLIHLPPP